MSKRRNRRRNSPTLAPPASPTGLPIPNHSGGPVARRTEIIAQRFEGPLPAPETLRAYDGIHPGAAAMILKKFEEQADHRRELELRVVKANIRQAYLGQAFAFVILIALCATGGYLAYNGKELGGLGTIATAIAGAVCVFILGRQHREKHLSAKREGERRG